MANYEIGQRVMYESPAYSRRYRESTVVMVGARKTILADGTEWATQSGRRWGSSYSWGPTRLIPADEKILNHSKAADLADRLRNHTWQAMRLDELEAVAALVFAERAKEQA